MNRNVCLILTALLLAPMAARCAAEPTQNESRVLDLNGFKLTFSDEFSGDQLDTSKWQAPSMPRQGSCRWVSSLATVHDGALHLGIRLSQDPGVQHKVGGRESFGPGLALEAVELLAVNLERVSDF